MKRKWPAFFDPFYTTDRGTYIGLGLFVVYNEVHHLLNGTIKCESTPGKGSTFILTLPNLGANCDSGGQI